MCDSLLKGGGGKVTSQRFASPANPQSIPNRPHPTDFKSHATQKRYLLGPVFDFLFLHRIKRHKVAEALVDEVHRVVPPRPGDMIGEGGVIRTNSQTGERTRGRDARQWYVIPNLPLL